MQLFITNIYIFLIYVLYYYIKQNKASLATMVVVMYELETNIPPKYQNGGDICYEKDIYDIILTGFLEKYFTCYYYYNNINKWYKLYINIINFINILSNYIYVYVCICICI